MPKPAKAPSDKGVQVGGKAVVAGDVISGNKTEIKSHGGDIHVHKTKEEIERENRDEFKREIGLVYDNGRITASEASRLEEVRVRLNLSKSTAKKLRKSAHDEWIETVGLVDSELSLLEEAYGLLFEEKNPLEALSEIQPLFMAHMDRGIASRTDINRIYYLSAFEIEPNEALKSADTQLDKYNELFAYFVRLEYFAAKNDKSLYRTALMDARAYDDTPWVLGRNIEYELLSDKKRNKHKRLERLEKKLDSMLDEGAVNKPPYLQALKVYLVFAKGNKTAFADAEETFEAAEDTEALFFLNRLKSRLNAGKLFLTINDVECECHHGDILGREGHRANRWFEGHGKVHRRHVEVVCAFGQWQIKAIDNGEFTNLTTVDGKEVKPGDRAPLNETHPVKISAGLEIELRVEKPTPSEKIE